MDVAAFLSMYHPFSSFEADRVASIARSVEIAHFPAGEVILEQGGTPASTLFVIRKGAVEVLDDGVVLDLLGEGELFGQFSLLDQVSPVATIRALEDTLAYLIPRPVAVEILSSSAGTSVVLATMRRRLAAANEGVSATRSGDRRFATIGSLIRRDAVTIEPDASIAEAAATMTEHRVSSLLLRTPEGWAILTDRDLRAKVVAARSSYDAPAIASATVPARTLPASTLAGDALLEMFAQGVHHFPVTDGDRVIGVVTDTDLMGIGRHTPFAIKSAIERADTREAVIAAGRELPNVVVALVDSNADPVSVGGVIALVIDALTERFVLLAGRSMGDAPAGFAWLSLGSAARHEQALHTDQDHALAYELPAGATDEDVDGYFADLAEFVTSGLEAVGIPRCTGDAMAVHPAMRRSLEQWTERFRRWMNEPDLDARILSSIGFDFRRVAGPLDAEPRAGRGGPGGARPPGVRRAARAGRAHAEAADGVPARSRRRGQGRARRPARREARRDHDRHEPRARGRDRGGLRVEGHAPPARRRGRGRHAERPGRTRTGRGVPVPVADPAAAPGRAGRGRHGPGRLRRSQGARPARPQRA